MFVLMCVRSVGTMDALDSCGVRLLSCAVRAEGEYESLAEDAVPAKGSGGAEAHFDLPSDEDFGEVEVIEEDDA